MPLPPSWWSTVVVILRVSDVAGQLGTSCGEGICCEQLLGKKARVKWLSIIITHTYIYIYIYNYIYKYYYVLSSLDQQNKEHKDVIIYPMNFRWNHWGIVSKAAPVYFLMAKTLQTMPKLNRERRSRTNVLPLRWSDTEFNPPISGVPHFGSCSYVLLGTETLNFDWEFSPHFLQTGSDSNCGKETGWSWQSVGRLIGIDAYVGRCWIAY